MSEKFHEQIKNTLSQISTIYYKKSLENYICFEAEETIPSPHTTLSRLYYSLFLACKGNLYLKQGQGPLKYRKIQPNGKQEFVPQGQGGQGPPLEYINHNEIVQELRKKHAQDGAFLGLLIYYNPLFKLRKKADYNREMLSLEDPGVKMAVQGGIRLLEAIAKKTLSELN